MTLLSAQNLGKAYRVYRSEWQRFARWFGLPIRPAEENWVLRHIGFDIQPGEAIGIVGQNGAGKSTLLKILTGTLQPTEGVVTATGRIAAILELGMGFNPELSGRQNVYHAAGLMGFNVEQVREVIDAIEAFAEIGDYFDEPMRTYSSGMQMRVAFAVTTAWRPDILIVDEALSVGDAYFQHKCFARIREFQAQGTSLLFVSHDKSAILALCGRAILLESGSVIRDGEPEGVMDFYNALIAEKENSTVSVTKSAQGKNQTVSGTGEAKVLDIGLYNSKGKPVEVVAVGEQVELRVHVKICQDVDSLVLGYGIKDRLGQVMYGTNTWHTEQVISNPHAGDEYLFVIAFQANYGVGSYSVQTALVDRDTHMSNNYEWRDLALVFQVANIDKKQFVGYVWNEPVIRVESLS